MVERLALILALIVACGLTAGEAALPAACAASQYLSLPHDVTVNSPSSAPLALLSATIDTSQCAPGATILVVSDGRFYPQGITVGALWTSASAGSTVGSTTVIDWANSLYPVEHSYNVLGTIVLSEATAQVQVSLLGATLNGQPFAVGAASNLAVFVLPPNIVATSGMLPADSPTYKFDVPANASPLPAQAALSVSVAGAYNASWPKSAGVIVLASGRSYQVDGPNHQGDAVWFVGRNGDTDEIRNNETFHSDNDMWVDAEGGNAPMFTHAWYDRGIGSPTTSVQLLASAETWGFCCNEVHYRIGAGLTLAALTGAYVAGGFSFTDTVNVGNTYRCVGSSKNWPGCPPVGTPYSFLSRNITIPAGHSGIVLFQFKTIVQADPSDVGGIALVQLAIDGVRVGSTGVQQLQTPDCDSTRTIGAGYLSSDSPLSEGTHQVEVLVEVTGSFIHLCFGDQLVLTWIG